MIVRNRHGELVAEIPTEWLLARLEKLRSLGVQLSRDVLEAVVRQWIEDDPLRQPKPIESFYPSSIKGWGPNSGGSTGRRMDLELHDALDGR